MKPWKRSLFILLAALTVLSLLPSACGPTANLHGNFNGAKDKIKEKLTQSNGDDGTKGDQDTGANKITICHKTGSAKHPYVEITISNDGAQHGHAKHQGDIIPAPKESCPSTGSTTATDKIQEDENETESETEDNTNLITICHKTASAKHPYVEITVSNDAAKNEHAKHQGDIIPAPKDGCPSTVVTVPTSAP